MRAFFIYLIPRSFSSLDFVISEVRSCENSDKDEDGESFCETIHDTYSENRREEINTKSDISPFLDSSLDHWEEEDDSSKSFRSFELPSEPARTDTKMIKHFNGGREIDHENARNSEKSDENSRYPEGNFYLF